MTPIELVLSKLPDARPTGKGQWQARCPAHDDRKPSLSIKRGDDGRALLHCHAGCTTKDICAAISLTEKDLFPQTAQAPKSKAAAPDKPRQTYPTPEAAIAAIARQVGGQFVKTWTYHNADGTECFRVARLALPDGDKTYRPFHHNGQGWIIGDPPGKLPLYRLPELLKADPAKPVFIGEGELVADAARSIGLVATTSAHGAKSAAKTDWKPLAGRKVIISPDNNTAGQRYADDVARILTGLNPPASIKIVELPGLPDGGDLVDWLAAIPSTSPEDNKADLLALVESAPVYEPPAEPEAEAEPGGAVMVCLADVKPERLRWLWPGRVPLGKVTLFAGDPDLGKSMLTLDIAARLSCGLPWPDALDAPTEAGSVVLLSAEDDISDTIRPRLDAAGADVNSIMALQGVMYSDDGGTLREKSFSLEHDLPALKEAITRTGNVRLVIIDPITAYLGRTNSHKNAEIRGLLAPLAQLAAEHKLAVIAITHLNKNAAGSAMYRAMGSLAFVAAARAVWLVAKAKEAPDHRRLFLPVKNNLAANGSGLAYTVQSSPDSFDIPVVEWEPDPITIPADEALNQNDNGHQATGDATAWLREALSDGQVKTKDLQRMANESGHAWRTVERAKKELGITPRREGFGPGAIWYWALPDHRPPKTP